MRIVLTGGGTGGHIFPLVSVAKKLKEKLGMEAELLYIGSKGKMEKEAMEENGIPVKYAMSGKVRRYFSLENIVDFLKIPIGLAQSLWILLVYMPDVVFSKGGYVSVPVVLAAWLYHIPVLIHESDAVPGVANKFLGMLAKRIAVSYPSAEKYFSAKKVALTGNPTREEILQGNPALARQKFNLTESLPTILIIGGSQGAQLINKAIIRIIPQLLHSAQIIHQTGENNFEEVKHLAAEMGVKESKGGYHATPFLKIDELKDVLAVADLVISRAGSNSISDIAAVKKPTLLIPLSSAANDHQRMNAYALAEIGAAAVLEENNLGENILMEKIEKLLKDKSLASAMAEKIKSFHHADAADKIADGIIGLVRE